VSASLAVPAQVATCGCAPDDYRPCNGEAYRCEGCGFASDDPMPYAEAMTAAGLDLTKHSSWFFYCKSCGADWLKDGAAVVGVRKSA
jgi:hypothetical protein